jgi:hypothetical protein
VLDLVWGLGKVGDRAKRAEEGFVGFRKKFSMESKSENKYKEKTSMAN